MKHYFQIKVTGKNVYRFIKRMHDHKIELFNIQYNGLNEVNIKIKKEDYSLVKKIRTIYEIKVINLYGVDKLKEQFKKFRYLFLFIALGVVLLLFLSNIIFEVEIVHNDKKIRQLLTEELEKHGIEKHHMKKSYDEIKKIKSDILNKYRDQIEWLEIKEVGVKYIVRVEERIITRVKQNKRKQNIVSKHNALILRIDANQGEIVKNIYDYVKPGDVIISGEILLNEEVKKEVTASGKVYGEVWYTTTVEFPLHYQESKVTGRKKKVWSLNLFHKKIELFTFHPYKHKKIKAKKILASNLLPISLTYEDQQELYVIDEKYSKKEAEEKAILYARRKIESTLLEKEKIINIKKLKVDQNNSKIILELFVTVYKDIGMEQKIEKKKESKDVDVRNN